MASQRWAKSVSISLKSSSRDGRKVSAWQHSTFCHRAAKRERRVPHPQPTSLAAKVSTSARTDPDYGEITASMERHLAFGNIWVRIFQATIKYDVHGIFLNTGNFLLWKHMMSGIEASDDATTGKQMAMWSQIFTYLTSLPVAVSVALKFSANNLCFSIVSSAQYKVLPK